MVSDGNEKETFWFFTAFLEKMKENIPFDGLKGFYDKDFPLLMQYMKVFNDLFREWIPELHQYFEHLGIIDSLWLQKWVMTCFLYSFPLGLCIRMWDNILAFGTRFIFNLSLAILGLLKDQLIELDFADINEFFKALKDDTHMNEKLLPPFEDIIEQAVRIHITDEILQELFLKHSPMAPITQQPLKIARKLKVK